MDNAFVDKIDMYVIDSLGEMRKILFYTSIHTKSRNEVLQLSRNQF